MIYLNTEIDGENAPAFRKIGLTGDALRTVFRYGSDGFVGLVSGFSASDFSHVLRKINIDKISSGDKRISHGEPAERFAADESQTRSTTVAERVNELFAKDNKTIPVFYAHEDPSPIGGGDIESIEEAARNVQLADIVNVNAFLFGGDTAEDNSSLLPGLQAFEEETRKFHYTFEPPESYPMVGDVFWTAELHGPEGVTFNGVSLETDPGDSSVVTVSVDPFAMGDVVLFLSYETTDGALVVGEPQWVTHQAPFLAEVDHLELLPDGYTFRIGESFVSELVTVYKDGTRLPRWLDPVALESVTSSKPDVVSVEDFPQVQALKAGDATLTVEAFGHTTEAQIRVEAEPAPVDFETWKSRYFTTEELADPDISGDSVDLDGDSLNLFLEFVTGGHPRIKNDGHLPRITKLETGAGPQNVTGFRISTRVEGERVTAEHSTDLLNWSELFDFSNNPNLNQSALVDYIEGDGYLEIYFDPTEPEASFFRLSVEPENP